MIKNSLFSLSIVAYLLCGNSSFTRAEEPLTLVKKEYNRDIGNDANFESIMTLTEKNGRTRQRDFEMKYKFSGELRKQYIRFTTPKTIKNTTFLSLETQGGDPDQYLYLPATGKVRRIASGQKAKSFVNSDYSYEDLDRRHFSKDRYEVTGSDQHLNRACTKIKRTPIDPDSSQYRYVESCISPELAITLYANYFDSSGKLMKVFKILALQQIQGIWTVSESILENIQDKTSTHIKTKQVTYNQGVSDSSFTRTYIKNFK